MIAIWDLGCRGRTLGVPKEIDNMESKSKKKYQSIHPSNVGADIIREDDGDAVVEATILFPIMILIFAALVMLAIYLPTHAALQHATQIAATAIAVEESDTWLFFDDSTLSYRWETDKSRLPNVYADLFSGIDDAAARSENIVTKTESGGISSKAGTLTVDCQIVNRIVYKEVVVTATRSFTIPGNFSMIGFPKTITITASSTAVVQNGEEFIRNIDMAVDFVEYISKKFGISNISETISTSWNKVRSVLGW